jgi:deoxyadenosine/deoxycytidine kinase
MIFLDCRVETSIARIKSRGRNMEKAIDPSYLKSLQENYYEFIEEMEDAGVRILRLNWESYQPISEVARLVHEYSLKPSNFTKWVRPLRKMGMDNKANLPNKAALVK